ncbi:hypothetical protein [Mucilaginibacter sp.]|uniref:hypothetical protein n=1 Tax=Mucilaginibacter sp. TaxID=1882438 RepID=UPI0025E68B91|nr:hypothetical protein [Mucilaginibacter sp.]
MDVTKIVIDRLKHEGINATCNESMIVWYDDFNDECHISEVDIDYSNGKLAWFQSNYWDKHLLRLFYNNGEYFSWEPITNDSCDCHLIEWYNDYLVFVYQEKHDNYICVVKDKVVTCFNFHGVEITRKKDVFYYREYRLQNLNILKRIKLPELIQLESITVEEAAKDGIVIANIDYPNDLRHKQ